MVSDVSVVLCLLLLDKARMAHLLPTQLTLIQAQMKQPESDPDPQHFSQTHGHVASVGRPRGLEPGVRKNDERAISNVENKEETSRIMLKYSFMNKPKMLGIQSRTLKTVKKKKKTAYL